MENVKLRDKKWVEFIQHMPDRDAVANQFYQFIGKGSKVKKFKAGQADLILELDYDEYLKINEHRECEEEQRKRVDSVQVDESSHSSQAATVGQSVTLSLPSTRSSDVYTASVLPAEHVLRTPVLLPPPSLHQETSTIHGMTRDNTYQKAVQIAFQPSKINQKVQGTVRTSLSSYVWPNIQVDLTIMVT